MTAADLAHAFITLGSGMCVGLAAVLLADCFVRCWFPDREETT